MCMTTTFQVQVMTQMVSTFHKNSPVSFLSSQIENVTLHKLFSMQHAAGMVRTGATTKPKERRNNYVYEDDYSGTMYVAPTNNMKKTEDELLKNNYPDNIHKTSNADEAPGYVYLIQKK